VHLFLIPLKRANGDSQMIFVLAEHTPFAAGAKRRDPTGKFIKFQKISGGTWPFDAWAALSSGSQSAGQLQNADTHSPTCAASLRKAHACNLGAPTRG
jgi:hypothetical protein